MHLINCTFHSITYKDIDGNLLEIPPSPGGYRPRVETIDEPHVVIDNVQFWRRTYAELVDIPPPLPDTYYIVSTIVAMACPNRHDFVVPKAYRRKDTKEVMYALGFAMVEESSCQIQET